MPYCSGLSKTISREKSPWTGATVSAVHKLLTTALKLSPGHGDDGALKSSEEGLFIHTHTSYLAKPLQSFAATIDPLPCNLCFRGTDGAPVGAV